MTLHLVKLCVGVGSPAELARWQRDEIASQKARGQSPELFHITRMTPKRREEILASGSPRNGSLYWVFRGVIAARQRILDIRPHKGRDGVKRCCLDLDLELVLTKPFPRRAFQGWRYLEAKDAPPDLERAGLSDDMPEELRAALTEAGLL